MVISETAGLLSCGFYYDGITVERINGASGEKARRQRRRALHFPPTAENADYAGQRKRLA